jgi:hypothetical protein
MPRVFEVTGRATGRIISLQDLDDLIFELCKARKESLRNGSERTVVRRSLTNGGEIAFEIQLPAKDLAPPARANGGG